MNGWTGVVLIGIGIILALIFTGNLHLPNIDIWVH